MDHAPTHRSRAELDAGLDNIQASPKDVGTLDFIVRRPATGEREVLEGGQLDEADGLVGDNWRSRAGPDGDTINQINIMNARAIELIAGTRDRWALAGDQLYVDLDLSEDNLPPGSQIDVGEARLEITPEPHLGCKKFVERYGRDAGRFVNSKLARRIKLRGLNARVLKAGAIRVGDPVRKVS